LIIVTLFIHHQPNLLPQGRRSLFVRASRDSFFTLSLALSLKGKGITFNIPELANLPLALGVGILKS
jgi:hypothetical protein